MALKIRLARGGSKKRPFYRVVVAEASAPRDGRFIEKLGTYNPLLASDHAERVVLNTERIQYWLSQGAHPTERVALFMSQAGLISAAARAERPKKGLPKKKAQERLREQAERESQAAEATE